MISVAHRDPVGFLPTTSETQMDVDRSAWMLPATGLSVRRARRAVNSVLQASVWDEQCVAEAVLMTDELATNAVVHARSPYTLIVRLTGRRLRVEVHDGSTGFPKMGVSAPPSTAGGRGLPVVAALSDRWGADPTASGKSVWFETSPPAI
jgi:anti-sigma regulatory factor (Ser/Thr protein kinase)